MKKIHIQADDFFEFLKQKEKSMWEIFAQLMTEQEQEIIFIDKDNRVLFNYILPNTQNQLDKDQKKFAEEFKTKLKSF